MEEETFDCPDARCIKQSEKAILVIAPDLEGETWIPQSQIHDDSEVYKEGHEGKLVIKMWWARKQGWI